MADSAYQCPECKSTMEDVKSPELGRGIAYCKQCEQYYSISSPAEGGKKIVPISEDEATL